MAVTKAQTPGASNRYLVTSGAARDFLDQISQGVPSNWMLAQRGRSFGGKDFVQKHSEREDCSQSLKPVLMGPHTASRSKRRASSPGEVAAQSCKPTNNGAVSIPGLSILRPCIETAPTGNKRYLSDLSRPGTPMDGRIQSPTPTFLPSPVPSHVQQRYSQDCSSQQYMAYTHYQSYPYLGRPLSPFAYTFHPSLERKPGTLITPSPSPPPAPVVRRVNERTRRHACKVCFQRFFRSNDLKRHMYVHGEPRPFVCPRCQKGFSRRDALERHKNAVLMGKRIQCSPIDAKDGNYSTALGPNGTSSSSGSSGTGIFVASSKTFIAPKPGICITEDKPLAITEKEKGSLKSVDSNSFSEQVACSEPAFKLDEAPAAVESSVDQDAPGSESTNFVKRLKNTTRASRTRPKRGSPSSPLFTLAFVAAMSAPIDKGSEEERLSYSDASNESEIPDDSHWPGNERRERPPCRA